MCYEIKLNGKWSFIKIYILQNCGHVLIHGALSAQTFLSVFKAIFSLASLKKVQSCNSLINCLPKSLIYSHTYTTTPLICFVCKKVDS